jgi:hypothetical protein
MKTFVKYVYILFSITFLVYLVFPSQNYPIPPEGSLQSNEPGDSEDPQRKAYFTNANRQEVMENYYSQLATYSFLPTIKMNYPPEDAQTLIRDQTRSTFLEEIVHPFRESFYINGFKPSQKKDAILIEDKIWYQKITVRYVTSSIYIRFALGGATIFLIFQLNKLYLDLYPIFLKMLNKNKLSN